MDFEKYIGKNVKIITDNGLHIQGKAFSVGYDEETYKDYLDIDIGRHLIEELYEEDIASIEVIES